MTQAADQKATSPNISAFATYEVDDVTFRFRKPKVAELDRMMSKMRKATVSASIDFSLEIVFPSDKDAWKSVLGHQPGAASESMNEVLEKLGFRL
jgi:hypothetical protein